MAVITEKYLVELRRSIELSDYQEPIAAALEDYQKEAGDDVAFDISAASLLTRTETKPYIGCTTTEVRHLGKAAARLTVIAFAPHDGTGNSSYYSPRRYLVDPGYTREVAPVTRNAVVPFDKPGVDSAIHMALLSHRLHGSRPQLFAGRLDVMGLYIPEAEGVRRIGKIASAGQSAVEFAQVIEDEADAYRTATLTTGIDMGGQWDDLRFGDPNALLNPYDEIFQVAALLTVRSDDYREHRELITKLSAQVPRPMPGIDV